MKSLSPLQRTPHQHDCRIAVVLSLTFLALPSMHTAVAHAFQFQTPQHPYHVSRLPHRSHRRHRESRRLPHPVIVTQQHSNHHRHERDGSNETETHHGGDDVVDPHPFSNRRNFISGAATATIATATGMGMEYSPLDSLPAPNTNSKRYDYDVRKRHCRCRYHHLPFHSYAPLILPPSANAAETELLLASSPSSSSPYDAPRNKLIDSFFSWNMDTTMEGYEQTVRPYKEKLFRSLLNSLSENYPNERGIHQNGKAYVPTIVELGMGTFPNAPYYAQALANNANENNDNNSNGNGKNTFHFQKLQIIGIDPNDSMAPYAMKNALRAGLLVVDNKDNHNNNNHYSHDDYDNHDGRSVNDPNINDNVISVRTMHGVAEALPFPDDSVDAVVATLTLCSVSDPKKALSEIRRVLKKKTNVEFQNNNNSNNNNNINNINNIDHNNSGGKYLFWEHVQSETDPGLAMQQTVLTPLQSFLGDGCHLNRRTGESIRKAGFDTVFSPGGMEYVEFEQFGLIGPTVMGVVSV